MDYFSLRNKIKKLTRSWPLDWIGCFGQERERDAPSFFRLWAWPLEASHYVQPKAPVAIFH